MNKDDEDKLANAIIALHREIKGLRSEFTGEIKGLRGDMNHRFEKLEKQQAKTNLAFGEMRLSYMQMADETSALRSDMNGLRSDFNGLRSDFNRYAESNNALVNNHESRIVRLEEKTPGNSYIASEPAVHYTRGERSRTKRKKRK